MIVKLLVFIVLFTFYATPSSPNKLTISNSKYYNPTHLILCDTIPALDSIVLFALPIDSMNSQIIAVDSSLIKWNSNDSIGSYISTNNGKAIVFVGNIAYKTYLISASYNNQLFDTISIRIIPNSPYSLNIESKQISTSNIFDINTIKQLSIGKDTSFMYVIYRDKNNNYINYCNSFNITITDTSSVIAVKGDTVLGQFLIIPKGQTGSSDIIVKANYSPFLDTLHVINTSTSINNRINIVKTNSFNRDFYVNLKGESIRNSISTGILLSPIYMKHIYIKDKRN